jgi:hypothetical protein
MTLNGCGERTPPAALLQPSKPALPERGFTLLSQRQRALCALQELDVGGILTEVAAHSASSNPCKTMDVSVQPAALPSEGLSALGEF